MKHILNVYERASGQVINKDKSYIMFSPNTADNIRWQMIVALSIMQEARSEKFLIVVDPYCSFDRDVRPYPPRSSTQVLPACYVRMIFYPLGRG